MIRGRFFWYIWAVLFVAYLSCVAGYGVYTGLYEVGLGMLQGLLRPQVLISALLISLLCTIPIFQFLLGARSRAYRRDVVRPNSDPFVLPADAEERSEKAARLALLKKQNDLSIKLWMLFVVLMSFIGLYLLFHSRALVRVTDVPVDSDTASTTETVATTTATTTRQYLPIDLPRFGNIDKTDEQRTADETYVRSMIERYETGERALNEELARAWELFDQRDADGAMRAFNRAWLLRATSSEVLYGMGLVEGVRGNFSTSSMLIEEALALDDARPEMGCDLARSYLYLSAATPTRAAFIERAADAISTVVQADAMTSTCTRIAEQVAEAQSSSSDAVLGDVGSTTPDGE